MEIGFTEVLYLVDEDDGTVTVCLELVEAEGELRRSGAIEVLVFTIPHSEFTVMYQSPPPPPPPQLEDGLPTFGVGYS